MGQFLSFFVLVCIFIGSAQAQSQGCGKLPGQAVIKDKWCPFKLSRGTLQAAIDAQIKECLSGAESSINLNKTNCPKNNGINCPLSGYAIFYDNNFDPLGFGTPVLDTPATPKYPTSGGVFTKTVKVPPCTITDMNGGEYRFVYCPVDPHTAEPVIWIRVDMTYTIECLYGDVPRGLEFLIK